MKEPDKNSNPVTECVNELTKLLDDSGLLKKYGHKIFGNSLRACGEIALKYDPSGRCKEQIIVRNRQVICSNPIGHEGTHRGYNRDKLTFEEWEKHTKE